MAPRVREELSYRRTIESTARQLKDKFGIRAAEHALRMAGDIVRAETAKEAGKREQR